MAVLVNFAGQALSICGDVCILTILALSRLNSSLCITVASSSLSDTVFGCWKGEVRTVFALVASFANSLSSYILVGTLGAPYFVGEAQLCEVTNWSFELCLRVIGCLNWAEVASRAFDTSIEIKAIETLCAVLASGVILSSIVC